jgi:hypothetical protein
MYAAPPPDEQQKIRVGPDRTTPKDSGKTKIIFVSPVFPESLGRFQFIEAKVQTCSGRRPLEFKL